MRDLLMILMMYVLMCVHCYSLVYSLGNYYSWELLSLDELLDDLVSQEDQLGVLPGMPLMSSPLGGPQVHFLGRLS